MSLFTYYHESETEIFEHVFKWYKSDETCAKISIANQNRSEEQRKAYGRMATDARIANGNRLIGERNGMYGKTHTAETRAKMSVKSKGRKCSNESKENRRKTMMDRYGKMGVNQNTHTFDGMSLNDFLDKNREYVLSLVDERHKYKYHKIHDYILKHHDSDTEISQNYRSMTLSRWFKRLDKHNESV